MWKVVEPFFPIMRAIKDPSVSNVLTIIWIVITMGIFLGTLMIYRKTLSSVGSNIDKAADAFKGTKTPSGTNYSVLSRDLPEDIKPLWKAFERTLIRTEGSEQSISIFAAVESGYFFNETSILAPKLNLRFYGAIPSILTGLGILGTFVGLTLGLQNLDFNADSVESLKLGIQGLISGMSIAFTSSVWGIFLSLIYQYLEKVSKNTLGKRIKSLQEIIDEAFPYRPVESWLSDDLWEARQQTAELKRFNTDLAISIAAALDDKLAARLTPALDKLLVAIETLTGAGSSELAKAISSSAGEEISRLSKVLSQASKIITEISDHSQSSQQEFATIIHHNLTAFTEHINGALADIIARQQSIDEQMESIISGLAVRVDESLAKQQESINAITSQICQELSAQASRISEEISRLFDTLSSETASIVAEMRGELLSASKDVKETSARLSESHNIEYREIRELLESLSITIQKADEVAARIKESADTLAGSASPVAKAIEGLDTTIKDFQSTQQSFANLVVIAQGQLEHYIQNTGQILSQINESLQTTRTSWTAYERNFAGLRGDLEEVFDELGKGLQEYAEKTTGSVNEFLLGLDKHSAEIVGHLAGAIQDLRDAVDELSDLANKSNGLAILGQTHSNRRPEDY